MGVGGIKMTEDRVQEFYNRVELMEMRHRTLHHLFYDQSITSVSIWQDYSSSPLTYEAEKAVSNEWRNRNIRLKACRQRYKTNDTGADFRK